MASTASSQVTRRGFLRAVTGGTVLAASGSASAQETTEGGDGGGGGGGTRTVDMTDDLVFDPDDVTVAPGTTVVWEDVGTIGHSVTAYEDGIPADAEYFSSAGTSSESAARNAYPSQGDVAGGESYEHTFTVQGTYEYFCIPHESVGMKGVVDVVPGGGQSEATGPVLPESAKTLGVYTTLTFLVTLSFAYFFLKYGGEYEAQG